jgi:Undecaprenyl-phosphate glucose phosphotransferase
MDTPNFVHQRRTIPGLQSLIARLLDVLLVVLGALAASQVRFEDLMQSRIDTAFVAFAAAFALVLFPAFGVYGSWRGRAVLRMIGQVSLAWLVIQGCGLTLMFSLHRTDFISRLWFAYWMAMTGGALIVWRMAVYTVLARVRHAGMNLRRVAVVGCGSHCHQVVRNIEGSMASGFRAVAAFDVLPGKGTIGSGVPVYDDIVKFAAYVRSQGVQELWLALPLSEERTLSRFVAEFRDDLLNVRFVPDMRSVALFDSGMIDLIGMPAINLVASPVPARALLKKEIFDRTFAACALVVLAPVLISISIAIKLSSRGPVFFTQKRKGADGRIFRIYKFRSMRPHAVEAGVVKQATRGDARVTRIGAILRRTSLDELPQFFNVLRGDMSVVGPRPHAIEHDELYQKVVKGYIHRYRIKPGITGWAQINGFRGETDQIEKMQGRVEHDLYYLRNWSFGLDMRIVCATIAKGLVHSNAY